MKGPRPNVKARVVAKAAVFRDHQILLLHRSFDAADPGMWDLPGGQVEEGETLGRAVRREVREETGIATRLGPMFHADLFGSFSRHGKIRPTVGVYFHCVAANPKVPHLDPKEHTEYAWVSLEDMRSYPTVPHLARAVELAFRTRKGVRPRGRVPSPEDQPPMVHLPVPT
ncbi:MAG TPA: NUDIX hydrolase [Thermoplasmata archaeon]|nr:NUDIX hydrolase [Thermoplasmata archaeon]